MSDLGWEWDPSLYAGSAAYYVRGRVSYTEELVDALVAELGLDGSGRLLDVGCGPGSLTLLLASWFEQATGLDADADMLAEGARQAEAAGITNVEWLHLRAEDLPPDAGPFRVVTLAQSFHWMDRARVARLLRGVLGPVASLCTCTPRRTRASTATCPCRTPGRHGVGSTTSSSASWGHAAGQDRERCRRPRAARQS